jgi:putative Mg2+ transporter-C (MgtC) family protein
VELKMAFDPIELRILGNVTLAMILGAIIGLDREFAEKPAGLRTHMLVSGSAALLVALGDLTVTYFDKQFGLDLIRADPIRIIAAVITGISFLGAGTIIRQGQEGNVEGLTTAASLLFASGVGISVALSHWILSVGASFLALIILRVIPFIDSLIRRSREHRN